MAYTTYEKPKPLTADELRWLEEMIRLQANVPTAGGKMPKKKKPKAQLEAIRKSKVDKPKAASTEESAQAAADWIERMRGDVL